MSRFDRMAERVAADAWARAAASRSFVSWTQQDEDYKEAVLKEMLRMPGVDRRGSERGEPYVLHEGNPISVWATVEWGLGARDFTFRVRPMVNRKAVEAFYGIRMDEGKRKHVLEKTGWSVPKWNLIAIEGTPRQTARKMAAIWKKAVRTAQTRGRRAEAVISGMVEQEQEPTVFRDEHDVRKAIEGAGGKVYRDSGWVIREESVGWSIYLRESTGALRDDRWTSKRYRVMPQTSLRKVRSFVKRAEREAEPAREKLRQYGEGLKKYLEQGGRVWD